MCVHVVMPSTQRDLELHTLGVATKPRNGSDNDSGVLVTGDETETFSSENDDTKIVPLSSTKATEEEPTL